MKDHRFIELLNLYVDHQLGPAEAAELEAAVLASPDRRRTYDQYCRLQRGCSLLGGHARSAAPVASRFLQSLEETERKIARPRHRGWQHAYTGAFGALATAACLTLLFVVNRSDFAPETDPLALQPSEGTAASEALSLAVSTVAKSSENTRKVELHPALSASGFGVTRSVREAEIAAHDPEALEWMRRVDQLPASSVVVDEEAFASRSALPVENRVYQSRSAPQGNAAFAAFQFQR